VPYDGSNGARARSSRIRAAHDDEATRLDSMRRRAQMGEAPGEPRASLLARAVRALVRRPGWEADPLERLERGVDGETTVRRGT
jgi:hypothetical protein